MVGPRSCRVGIVLPQDLHHLRIFWDQWLVRPTCPLCQDAGRSTDDRVDHWSCTGTRTGGSMAWHSWSLARHERRGPLVMLSQWIAWHILQQENMLVTREYQRIWGPFYNLFQCSVHSCTKLSMQFPQWQPLYTMSATRFATRVSRDTLLERHSF